MYGLGYFFKSWKHFFIFEIFKIQKLLYNLVQNMSRKEDKKFADELSPVNKI